MDEWRWFDDVDSPSSGESTQCAGLRRALVCACCFVKHPGQGRIVCDWGGLCIAHPLNSGGMGIGLLLIISWSSTLCLGKSGGVPVTYASKCCARVLRIAEVCLFASLPVVLVTHQPTNSCT